MVTAIHPIKSKHAAPQQAATLGGVDPQDFVRDNRIHIKDGSLFIDPYLVVHPRELAPQNEAKLREKLKLTYSINNPSFFESYDRTAIALNLGQLVPTSLAAKHSKLMDEVKKYNAQVDTGVDADLQKLDRDKQQPFAAIVRDTLTHPGRDAVGIETLKNGLAIYLLAREKVTSQGYLNPLASYVGRSNTPDQVLGELAAKIGLNPLQVRQAALKGGVDGVGKLLGLDPAYVADVKKLTEYAATQEFSYNLVEHWHLGRQLLGIAAPIPQKIASGMEARITAKINDYRGRVRHFYDVPEPVKAEENRIADALTMVEPVQRALMYKLGYEIGYTPDYFADGIAKYSNIYGLHRKAANDMRDIKGTYRIYFSGRGELKGSMRTFVHEIAHNLWPEQFTADEVKKIDSYVASDAAHFTRWQSVMGDPVHFQKFEGLLKAYQAGNDAEKAAVMKSTNEWLQHHGVTVDGLFPYLSDARKFQFLVKEASERLSIEGEFFAKSSYESPHERMREIISRFAEWKQVELPGEPQLLHFLAPGLDQVWEAHYIPHLKRVYQQVVSAEQTANATIGKARTSAHKATDPLATTETPKVVERPVAANETPKVAERPVGAVACMGESHPHTTVDAGSIQMNARVLEAMNTLDGMGVHPGR